MTEKKKTPAKSDGGSVEVAKKPVKKKENGKKEETKAEGSPAAEGEPVRPDSEPLESDDKGSLFVTVKTEKLKRIVKIMEKIPGRNAQLPVLECVLISIEKSAVVLTVTNLEYTVTAKAPVKSEQKKKLLVKFVDFAKVVKSANAQELILEASASMFTITDGLSTFTVPCMGNPASFPTTQKKEYETFASVSFKKLKDITEEAATYVGHDDLRQILTAIHIKGVKSPKCKMEVVATDAHRLFLKKIEVNSSMDFKINVPAHFFSLLNSIETTDEKQMVSLETTKESGAIRVSQPDIIIESVCISGTYPNYEAVIPKENAVKLPINVTGLESIVKRIDDFNTNATKKMILNLSKIKNLELCFSTSDIETAKESTAVYRIPKAMIGEAGFDAIGINSKFLHDTLKNTSMTTAYFHMSVPNKAILLSPSEADDNHDDIRLIMPVMM